MDGQFDRVMSHFRLNLLQMVGVDLDLAPDLTVVQRPHNIHRARRAATARISSRTGGGIAHQ